MNKFLVCFSDAEEYYIKYNKIRYPKRLIDVFFLKIQVFKYMVGL
jgi:hypothetical protein